MDYQKLTEKQKRVLEIIIGQIKTLGFSPTIREIRDRCQIKSLRGVTLQLEKLEEVGLLSRKKGARSIRIDPSLLQPDQGYFSVPLMSSSIPAGTAFFAEDHVDKYIKISLLQSRGLKNVFAVEVSGDSMIGAGINSGDIAIIAPQPVANDGEIIAALYENGVTLKRFRIVEGRAMLFPANPKYKPILENFSIQGKLISLIPQKKTLPN
ncbi:MAG: transcriptional repressor LexA [Patescibacteria group bacterium]